jgi:hypothetical protein
MQTQAVIDIRAGAKPEILAPVSYITPGTRKPYAYEFDPPPGTPRRSATYRDHVVRIRNARELDWRPCIDQQSFEMRYHRSRVSDFYDDDEVRRVYYPEVAQIIREATGAGRVEIFDHTVRGNVQAMRGGVQVQEPASRVHNDYTPRSAVQRVHDIAPADAGELLRYRFAEINVWRPIRGPLESFPLGLIDARTIHPHDLVATDLIYRDRIGEIYYLAHNPAHEWYYYPGMTPQEVLLLKCFDSDTARTQFGAHAAFKDPGTSPGALPRESIEVRAFAFFAPAG